MKRYSLGDDENEPDLSHDYESKLNDQQLEVVRARGGPMLVIAGAGSGKTRTLTYRVAHLVDSGVPPERILLLTFTNKAAESMTSRVGSLVGGDTTAMWSGTFHSVANRLLRREADHLGYDREYTILDSEDARTLMKTCRSEADVETTEEHFPKAKLLSNLYSHCVDTQSSLEEALDGKFDYLESDDRQRSRAPDIRRVFDLYQSRKLEMNLMDFDDLLLNAKHLLEDVDDVRERYREQFQHVLIDEYHDTNTIQNDLVELLTTEGDNLMVVGDDCQSIYSFRGADYRNILEFPDRHPDCEQYKLEINYRSTPEILELANASIRHNEHQFQKTLRAHRPSGPDPVLAKLQDRDQQAAFVCTRILELIDEGWGFDDVAVLYRSHHHSMELQVEMAQRDIPFVVRSGLRFFEKAHIKDVLAHLKFIYNPEDELSFERVARQGRGIGPARSNRIWSYLQSRPDALDALTDSELRKQLPGRASHSWERLSERLAEVRDRRMESPGAIIEGIVSGEFPDYLQSTYENPDQRLDDLQQLADYAHQFPDLDRFLGEISLLTDVSSEGVLVGEERDEYVTLSSVHQAKGLEWPVVFVLSLVEGEFP
ncbi:MAG: ATP-dependent helicase, partial [Bradymonadaceae bacterium]